MEIVPSHTTGVICRVGNMTLDSHVAAVATMAVMEGRQPLEILRRDREQRGMTPSQYARFLDEGRPTVHRWETGERKIGQSKLPKVAEKTGIAARDLRPDLAELFGEAAQ